MKRICKLALLVLVVYTLQACSGANTPEDVAVETMTYLLEGKYEKVAENVLIPEDAKTEDEIKEFKEKGIEIIKEGMSSKYGPYSDLLEQIEENKGFKKVKAKPYNEESIAYYANGPEGDRASVDLIIVCKNGEELDGKYIPLRKRDGKWKVKL